MPTAHTGTQASALCMTPEPKHEGHVPFHLENGWARGHKRSPKVNGNEQLKAGMRSLTHSLCRLKTDSPATVSHRFQMQMILLVRAATGQPYKNELRKFLEFGLFFRSTSKSRPNNIRGKKCLPVRPSVRTSVRPQKVSSI